VAELQKDLGPIHIAETQKGNIPWRRRKGSCDARGNVTVRRTEGRHRTGGQPAMEEAKFQRLRLMAGEEDEPLRKLQRGLATSAESQTGGPGLTTQSKATSQTDEKHAQILQDS